MFIQLNGSECEVPDACTVESLVQRRGLADQPCAVEVNRQLVPKRQHAERELSDGDTVELVTLVGGG